LARFAGSADYTSGTASTTFTISLDYVIVDDPQATYVGNWTSYVGAGYDNNQHYTSAGNGSATATYTFSNLPTGAYSVYASWPAAGNHGTNVPYSFYDGANVAGSTLVNKAVAPTGTTISGFQRLAVVNASSGGVQVVISNNTNNFAIADAIELVPAATLAIPVLTVSGNSVAIGPNETSEASNGTLFAATMVGKSVSQTYTIHNAGTTTLSLSGASPVHVQGTNAANFVVTQPSVKSLAAGASATFQVVFSPSAVGLRTATLTIASNDPNDGQYTFSLQGSSISPTSLLDDTQARYVGNWTEYIGTGYNNNEHYASTGNGSATATYAFTGLAAGEYQVSATWPVASNHATNTPYAFYNGSAAAGGVTVNQSAAPTANGPNGFQVLGTVDVSSGTLNVVISNIANANSFVIADAVEISPVAAPTAPQLSVSGNSLAIVPNEVPDGANGTLFGSTPVTRTFTIANTGAGTLTLSGASPVTVAGTNAADFVVTQPTVTSLAAGASTTFQVQFAPSGSGTLSATLTIASNDATNSGKFVFGLQGTTVGAQPIILNNTQATYVGSWTSYTGAGYDNSQHYIAAGTGSATATYAFTGLAAGEYQVSATWPAASNHATNTPYAFYNGSTAAGGVTVNQSAAPTANGPNGFQVLGTVNVSSGTMNVVISNNANNYVIADAVEITPVAAATVPQLIASGNSLAIVPSEAPDSANGTLFGTTSTSATHTFTITNAGLATLTLGSSPVQITGANANQFSVTQPAATSLAAGASTTFQVKFVPTANGAQNANISIVSNAPNSPFVFGVQGTGQISTATLLDDTQATYVGNWTSYTGAGYDDDQHYIAAGSGSATAMYSFTGLAAGQYQVYATWPAASNHGTNVPYSYFDGSTAVGTPTLVDQALAPTGSGPNSTSAYPFQLLATVTISSGTLKVVIDNKANGYVIADAVEIVPVVGGAVAQSPASRQAMPAVSPAVAQSAATTSPANPTPLGPLPPAFSAPQEKIAAAVDRVMAAGDF
jgi:hypothetical protein